MRSLRGDGASSKRSAPWFGGPWTEGSAWACIAALHACSGGGEGPPAVAPADGGALTDVAAPPGPAASPAMLSRCSPDRFCLVDVSGKEPGDSLTAVWGDGAGVVWVGDSAGNLYRGDGSGLKRVIHFGEVDGGSSAVARLTGAAPGDIWALAGERLYHGVGADSTSLVWQPWPGGGAFADVFVHPVEGPLGLTVAGVAGPSGVQSLVRLRESSLGAGATPIPPLPNVVLPSYTRIFGSNAESQSRVLLAGSQYDQVTVDPLFPIALVVERAPAADAGAVVWNPLPTTGGGGPIADGSLTPSGTIALAASCGQTNFNFGETADGGDVRWANVWPENCRDAAAIVALSGSDIWVGGPNNMLRHFDGTSWQVPRYLPTAANTPFNIAALWQDSASGFWVVSDKELLHRSAQNSRDGSAP